MSLLARLRRFDPRRTLAPGSRQNTIVFASLPKSGTEFVSGGIRDATGLALPWQIRDQDLMNEYLSGYYTGDAIYSTGVFVSEWLVPKRLRELLPYGHVVGLHARATYHNLRALRDAGVGRLTVLVRDPRDSTVSWTYHLRRLDKGMRNYNSFIQHLPPEYYDWPHPQQLAFQVRTFLPSAVNWIESWLDAAAGPDPALEIQIVYFDELKRDIAQFFTRLFTFHRVEPYDVTRVQPPTVGERHYRQGDHDSWRAEFADADRLFAENLIGNRMQSAFDRTAGREPAYEAADAAERAGDDLIAAGHLLSLLRRYGAFGPAWERLERIVARRGIAVERSAAERNPFVIPESDLQLVEARLKCGDAHSGIDDSDVTPTTSSSVTREVPRSPTRRGSD